ncbi:MAG: YdcF family protein [Candidatus Obscuribacterales bacterium]|nr:YdcF family protein [Candidatus Obscuribacterales bacterium]
MSLKSRGCTSNPVIVVPGYGMTPHGEPTVGTVARTRIASQLARSLPEAHIIVSGLRSSADHISHKQTEAKAMRRVLLREGIRRSRVQVEEQARDTIGNAVLVAARFLAKRQPGTVMVVTSPFHFERARFVFEHVLGPKWTVVMVAAPEVFGDAPKALEEGQSLARAKAFFDTTCAGDLKSIWHLLVTKHDCYKHLPNTF